MSQISILTEKELKGIIRLDADAVACIEDAFHALATKPVVMPPILRLDIVEARGEVDVKTAYVPGLDGFAIKISPGFFDNPSQSQRPIASISAANDWSTGIPSFNKDCFNSWRRRPGSRAPGAFSTMLAMAAKRSAALPPNAAGSMQMSNWPTPGGAPLSSKNDVAS